MLFGHTETLKIEKKEGFVSWNVDLPKGKHCDLRIANGIQCVVFNNGVKGDSLYSTSQKNIVNNKAGEVKVVAVDRISTFPVRCGCAGVSFTDYEIDEETTVGMNGTMNIKIVNPNVFVDAFNGAFDVNIEGLEDYFRKNLNQTLSMALSACLSQYGKDVDKEIVNMGEPIKKHLNETLKTMGVQVESFMIGGVKFADEYVEARKNFFEKKKQDKEDKKRKREEQEEQDRELDALERIASFSKKSVAATADEDVYCPVCGFKNKSTTAYCEKCGNKLK